MLIILTGAILKKCSLSVSPRQHSKWYVWYNSPLSIVCRFDVKFTSHCFAMCLFVLNRTIAKIIYTIWTIHVRSPHMCACTKSGPGFLMSYGLVLFYVQRFDVRCHCWYLWNCLSSLFKISSQNHAFLFDKRYPGNI
jgi:hypothetical protein